MRAPGESAPSMIMSRTREATSSCRLRRTIGSLCMLYTVYEQLGLRDTGSRRRDRVAGIALVDAHQHFWDPGVHYYPWLNDEPPIVFRYGDYGAIRRRYLPTDYLADAAPYQV